MEDRIKESQSYNQKGLDYLNRNQPGKAIENFDKAIKLNSNDASYWNNKGITNS